MQDLVVRVRLNHMGVDHRAILSGASRWHPHNRSLGSVPMGTESHIALPDGRARSDFDVGSLPPFLMPVRAAMPSPEAWYQAGADARRIVRVGG